VVRPSKLIIYENPKILDTGCSRNGFVIDFYIKISKLVIFATYNHVWGFRIVQGQLVKA